jgi:hypothetical protein
VAYEDLDPDGQHVGVIVALANDTPEDHAQRQAGVGQLVPGARQVWVTWALRMSDREGHFLVHLQSPVSAIADLPTVEIDDAVADQMRAAARDYLDDIHESVRFIDQARDEIRRLVGE